MANDIDKTSPHYKGDFGSIYEVNKKFPTGGVAGDFVVIEGWAHYWNADRATWCVNAERDSYWDELITNIIEKFKLIRGATYMGVASLDTVPAKVIGAKMYYFATVAGTYKNFGDLVVPQGINVLYSENGSSWVNTTLLEVAQELGVSTKKVVSQKALNDALNLKADQSSVNEALAKKADKETVKTELAKKFDKESVVQESGEAEDKVMSQKAVSDKLSDLLTFVNDIIARVSQILPLDSNIGKYSSAIIDEQGNIGFALTKEGKSLFDEDKAQFDNKVSENAQIRDILSNVEKILDSLVFGLSKSGFVDANGNAVLYADKQGVHLANVVSHDIFGRTTIIDEQGNIGFALTKEGKSLFDEDKAQFDNKVSENAQIRDILSNVEKILDSLVFGLSKSGFVDANGNAVLYADKQGVHLANVVSHDIFGRTAIIDEQGNIGFVLCKNGKILGNFDIATTKKIKIGKYTFTVDSESINLPENLFTYNTAKLMLPSKIPYVVGQQMYVYYESILYNGFVKDFTIFSRVANEAQQNDCHIYHSSVEEDTINFRLGNSFGNQIESKRVSVKVLDKSKEGNLKICVIGDSKSANATKQAEVLNLCQKDGKLSVRFVGTLNKIGYDSDDNERTFSNCAISGSGIPDWCCGKTIASIENPFYDENVESGINVTMRTNTGNYNNSPIKFSIEKAISKIGDFGILWIDHGANQLSNEETFKCYDYIISDVKRYNKEKGKNIKIVISIQEGFGLIPQYDSIIRNVRTKDAMYRAANYIDKYDNRESEGVFVCPQYLNVDLWNDFPCTMVCQNSRNKDITKKVCLDPIHPGVNTGAYLSNKQYYVGNVCAVGSGLNRDRNMYLSLTDNLGVEPNDDKIHWAKASNSLNSGYYKIADMYYATIRYILSLT